MKHLRVFLLATLVFGQIIFLQAKVHPANQKSSSLTERSPNPLKAQADYQTLAEELATSYLNKTPVRAVSANLTLEQAMRVQDQFVQALIPSLGKIVGYKAGLTSKPTQSRFNVSHPLQGVLLEKMLLKSGAVVPAKFGARPMVEGDLMVRVGSEEINTATTPGEALAALDAVIPFIELPDLVYAEDVQLDASALVAINVGARLGVLGEPIPLAATDEWLERLGRVQVIILERAGNQLAVGESLALLGEPLKAVLWLKDSLLARGKSLKKGDLLSNGSITPPIPVEPGSTIRAQYIGLDANEPVEISVGFD